MRLNRPLDIVVLSEFVLRVPEAGEALIRSYRG
jgi:hypothetical protein